ncbi:MAG: Uma2 family endonuclease [Cyanobacteria bacterium J06636_16]
MAQAITRPNTFEDFIQIPYDGRITEFVNGEVVEVGTHDPTIGRIIKKLTRLLDNHIETIGLDWEAIAESSTIEIPKPTGKSNGRVPDIVVATYAQWETIERPKGTATFLKGDPPILAIEVVSRNSRQKDFEKLPAEYAIAGIPEYWIVGPDTQTVTVLTLQGNSYTQQTFTGQNKITSATFPALKVTAEQIFARDR